MNLEHGSVEVYTRPGCSACVSAKIALRDAGIHFTESVKDVDHTRDTIMERYPSAVTYPVIVVDGFYIGGYTQLNEALRGRKKLLTEGEFNGA